MKNNVPKDYIANIAKSSAYFAFRNGPIKELVKNNKVSEEELLEMQRYMQNHLAYLYNVLLDENDLKKFELVINTMNKFYINDSEEVVLEDDGFDNFFNQLFPSEEGIKTSNIKFK